MRRKKKDSQGAKVVACVVHVWLLMGRLLRKPLIISRVSLSTVCIISWKRVGPTWASSCWI